jgi:putative two-component system response regulator
MKKLSDCVVLAVDDTEANLDILVDALGDEYQVSVALDGISALDTVNYIHPDLILLDIMMPNMNGYEVCKKLKFNPITANIPVIFLTAINDIESKAKGFRLGAVDYITKPFDIIEVKARLLTHLSLRLARLELSMHNEELEKKVLERKRELSLTQEATIEALARLSEYRDPETGEHIQRTKRYVKALAEKMLTKPKFKNQLSLEIIDSLYLSAPLHDIGKIGIRDSILMKKGKLTVEEFEEMKCHTLIGYNAIKTASQSLGENSFLKFAMELARHHHEKWDGTGYPDGLSKDEIPLASRIMAIADVYDALISKRSYKPPLSHREAVKIISQSSGTHFDPDIVEVFLEINEEFYKIALENADVKKI